MTRVRVGAPRWLAALIAPLVSRLVLEVRRRAAAIASLAWLLFSGLGMSVACRDNARSPFVRHLPPPGRFAPLALLSVSDSRVVREIDLSREAQEGWRGIASTGLVRMTDGLRSTSGSAAVRLDFSELPDAGVVNLIELELSDLDASSAVDMRWRSAGESVRNERSIRALARDATPGPTAVLRFDLSREPQWSGSIESLEFRLVGSAANRPLLRRVRFIRSVLDEKRLAELAPRPWRVEIDSEIRDSYLLTPAVPWTATLGIAGASQLVVDSGVLIGSRPAIRGRAEYRDSQGRSIGSLNFDLGERGEEARGWRSSRVALAPPHGSAGAVLTIGVDPDESGNPSLLALSGVAIIPDSERDRRPNILLVSIDTLRADRVSLYGAPRGNTPALDAWAELPGTAIFERAYAGASSTLPSHATLLTGRSVLAHGAYDEAPLSRALPTLAEALAASGFRTAAVTGGGYLHPRYGLDRGFQSYRHWQRPPGGRTTDLDDGIERVLTLLKDGSRPQFVFLHTYDVHGPYRDHSEDRAARRSLVVSPKTRGGIGPAGLERWPVVFDGRDQRDLADGEIPLVRELYDSGVRRMDGLIGRLLEGIRSLGLEGSTLIVFTADHGESLGEDRLWGHGYLVETNLHVPLVLRIPGAPGRGARVPEPVSLVDVTPTILEWAIGKVDESQFDGHSLLRRVEGGDSPGLARVVWSYAPEGNAGLAAIRGQRKLVVNDSVFAPVAGRALDFDVASDSVSKPAAAGVLLEEAERKLRSAASGWILRVDNPGRIEGLLSISSSTFGMNNVKWVDSFDARASFAAPGRVELALNRRPTLSIRHTTVAGELDLELKFERGAGRWSAADRISRGAACKAEVEVGRLRSEEKVAASMPPIRVLVSNRGPCDDELPEAADRALLEQLRGLGYLQ